MTRMGRIFTLCFAACALLAAGMTHAGGAPRPEHPRPDQYRDRWINLNGEWNFQFDPAGAGESEGWYKTDYNKWEMKINVPFPWESALSGVTRPDYQGAGWYQRTFTLPDDWSGKTVLLHFGAVDWSFKVWLNGQPVEPQLGDAPMATGYTPVTFILNPALTEGENVLTVRAFDDTDPHQPTGKQIGWYTRTSGIWQTVYLEALGAESGAFIQNVAPFTKNDGSVTLKVLLNRPAENLSVRVVKDNPVDAEGPSRTLDDDVKAKNSGEAVKEISFKIKKPWLWSPETPTLYFAKVELLDGGKVVDGVHTYFGFREVERKKWKGQDYESIHLNGKPFYIVGALNQAFHPEGVYTYPSDERIRQDVADAKRFGFNNLRLHIKIDEPRFYYWCDRLGLTLLYDIPSFWEYSGEAKQNFTAVAQQAVERDFNHPSILSWVIFNETWGLRGLKQDKEKQQWVKQMVDTFHKWDPTRLVEDNSPCNYDHVVTDVDSWHFYIYEHPNARKHVEEVVEKSFPGSDFNYANGWTKGTEPLINSEYGGVSAGMGDRDVSWCFHYLTNEIRRHGEIGGYIYTELQDIEWEHNGFMNYDRGGKVFGYETFVPQVYGHPPVTYRDLNTEDYLVLDAIAGETIEPGEVHEVPAALCLYSGRPSGKYTLRWRVFSQNRFMRDWFSDHAGTQSINATAYQPSYGDPIRFHAEPDRLYLLYAFVEDEAGDLVARNFWVFNTLEGDYAGVERLQQMARNMKTGKTEEVAAPEWYIRWNPGGLAGHTGEIETAPERIVPKDKLDSVSIPGKAEVKYRVSLPEDVDLGKIKKAKLQFELAACAGGARLEPLEQQGAFTKPDWRKRSDVTVNPQTDVGNEYPSTVQVVVNGEVVSEIDLPNDPADYNGVLSNIFESAPPSSYGYLHRIYVPVELLKKDAPNEIAIRTKPGVDHGLRVFGAHSGRHPFPPTLILFESGEE
ncbi:MAG: hypothetical protein GC154_20945 [bacterium]|nr:hypothetical protein [bacterium]